VTSVSSPFRYRQLILPGDPLNNQGCRPFYDSLLTPLLQLYTSERTDVPLISFPTGEIVKRGVTLPRL